MPALFSRSSQSHQRCFHHHRAEASSPKLENNCEFGRTSKSRSSRAGAVCVRQKQRSSREQGEAAHAEAICVGPFCNFNRQWSRFIDQCQPQRRQCTAALGTVFPYAAQQRRPPIFLCYYSTVSPVDLVLDEHHDDVSSAQRSQQGRLQSPQCLLRSPQCLLRPSQCQLRPPQRPRQ